MMAAQFGLNEEQLKKFNEWRATKVEARTAIGGAYTFEFTPTTIGLVVKVTFAKGSSVEDTLDLTEYDDW